MQMLRTLAAVCTTLLSSCQVISGLNQLTPDGPRSEAGVHPESKHTTEGHVETRTSTGLLAGSFALDAADIAQHLDAGADGEPCAQPMDREDCDI